MPKIRIHTAAARRNRGFAFSTGGFVGSHSYGSQWFIYVPRLCVVITAEWSR